MTSPQWISKQDPDWLTPGSPADPRLLHSGPDDCIQLYPDGQGYRQEILLQDDLSIAIIDYTLQRDFLVKCRGEGKSRHDCFLFEFQFSGLDLERSFCSSSPIENEFSIQPRRGRVFEVEVILKRPLLEQYHQAVLERLPEQLLPITRRVCEYFYSGGRSADTGLTLAELSKRLLKHQPTQRSRWSLEQSIPHELYVELMELHHSRSRRSTPAMKRVAAQLFSCPYQGATRRRYLKRQALKLVALHLEALGRPPLPRADLNCIYAAAAILRQQMATPPDIEQLARQVCTNRLKLHRGFRAVYDTTPMGYLRTHRISSAYHLLLASEASVGQVATAVGITNRNRFAAAFRQSVGLNPKTFQLLLQQHTS